MTLSDMAKKNFLNSYRRRENIKKTYEIIKVQGFYHFFQKTIRYLSVKNESEITNAIKQYSGKNKIFIDIGAGSGYIGLNAAVYFDKCIFFEPSKENFDELAKKVKEIKCNNVILQNVALADNQGQRTFYFSKNSRWNHRFHVSNKEDGEEFYSSTIQTETLDSVIEKLDLNGPFVIKIDVEGAEPLVMKGAQNVLKKDCVIISEFSPWLMNTGGNNPLEFFEFMKSLGFSFFDLNNKPADKMVLKLCKKAIDKKRVAEDFIIKKIKK